MDFTPMKKNKETERVKNALLTGKIIRYDGHHDKGEILPRDFMGMMKFAQNLFQDSWSTGEDTFTSSIIKEVLEDLRKDYVVTKVLCEGSGCCQYATWAVYLS